MARSHIMLAVFSSKPCAAIAMEGMIFQLCFSHRKTEALTPWLLWPWSHLLVGCFLKGIIHKMGQKLWNGSRSSKAVYSRFTFPGKGSEKMETTNACSCPLLYQYIQSLVVIYMMGPSILGILTWMCHILMSSFNLLHFIFKCHAQL